MRKTIAFVTALLCLGFVLEAQPQGVGQVGNYNPSSMPADGYLSGILRDEVSGEPVEFASIALYSYLDSSLITGTITNIEGKFEFTELSYGMYFMDIRFVGYKTTRMTRIGVSPAQKVIEMGDINMARSVTELEEVEVMGQRSQVEYKIDRKVVNVSSNIASAGGTAADALENVPSIERNIDGNVTLRGSSNYTVLIDGRPSVFEGSEALQQLSASSIERIEIITNPSAKYDPDGTAGIINVVMKKQKEKGFNGITNVSYGSFNQFNTDILLNYRINKFNFFGGFELQDRSMVGSGISKRETYLGDTTHFMSSLSDENGGRNGLVFRAGMDFYLNDNNTFTLQGYVGSHGFERSSTSLYHTFTQPQNLETFYLQDNVFDVNNDYYSLNLLFDHDFDKKGHEIQTSVYYSNSDGFDEEELLELDTDPDWQILDAGSYRQRSVEDDEKHDFRFNVDYVKPFGEQGRFEAGYQLSYGLGKSAYIFDKYDAVLDDWANVEAKNNNIEFSRNIQSGYAIFGNSTKIIDFQVGLRAEYTDRLMDQLTLDEQYRVHRLDFFPSAHISRQFSGEQQLQLSYSRRINRPREYSLDPFPNYIDKFNIRMGNPELEPEFVNSYELNYQKRFKGVMLTAETYYHSTQNMISRISYVTDENIMISTSDNVGMDQSLGAELTASMSPFKWWQLSLSGTMYRYWINGEIEGEQIDRTTNTWNSRLNSNIKLPWGTRIQLTTMYRAPSVTAQGTRSAFYMVNGGIRHDFLDNKLSLNMQVRDIFRTMKFSSTSEGADFYSFMERKMKSPVFTLSLSYRINNFKKRVNSNGDVMEMEYAGDDMIQ